MKRRERILAAAVARIAADEGLQRPRSGSLCGGAKEKSVYPRTELCGKNMRPSGTPQEVGLGAGVAGAAVGTSIVALKSCARPGIHAKIRITDNSNTIPLIRFFKTVLLFDLNETLNKSLIPAGSTLHLKRSAQK